jgi:hypothetical protein
VELWAVWLKQLEKCSANFSNSLPDKALHKRTGGFANHHQDNAARKIKFYLLAAQGVATRVEKLFWNLNTSCDSLGFVVSAKGIRRA